MMTAYAYKDCPSCCLGGCVAPYVLLAGDSRVRTGPWQCQKCGWDSKQVDLDKGYVYHGAEEPPTVSEVIAEMKPGSGSTVGEVLDDAVAVVTRSPRKRRKGRATE